MEKWVRSSQLDKAFESLGSFGSAVEAYKIHPRLMDMKIALGNSTGLLPADIGLKATTNEGIDEIGRGLAVAAHAVVLLKS